MKKVNYNKIVIESQDLIRNIDGLTGSDAFEEIVKIIFTMNISEKMDVNSKKKRYFKTYTAEDGTRIMYLPWKKKQYQTRKWWVENDQFCSTHPKLKRFCRDIIDAGNGEYHMNSEGEHLRTMTNFRPGKDL